MSALGTIIAYDLAGLAVALVLGALPLAAWRRWSRRRAAELEWEHDAAVRAEADREIARVDSYRDEPTPRPGACENCGAVLPVDGYRFCDATCWQGYRNGKWVDDVLTPLSRLVRTGKL